MSISRQKPQLQANEAIKLAFSRMFQLQGRSRRSEFWWFFLVFFVAQTAVSFLVTTLFGAVVASFVSPLLWVFAYATTVRRMHDVGQSHWIVTVSWVINIFLNIYTATNANFTALLSPGATPEQVMETFLDPVYLVSLLLGFLTQVAVLVFCLIDSKKEENRYGKSPKYE